ncbi:hypothetical protein [Lactobacillus amylovorus]|uniref:hypothetical protein n=1 Tax=Lactobacillus amylovorus TaxID=1604 RepID=UPI0021A3D6B0|nr:hypothetical protein [Lactobacillus amylovorus]MCT3601274.1 hypothetical protein [Lactobacillus amylovorus]
MNNSTKIEFMEQFDKLNISLKQEKDRNQVLWKLHNFFLPFYKENMIVSLIAFEKQGREILECLMNLTIKDSSGKIPPKLDPLMCKVWYELKNISELCMCKSDEKGWYIEALVQKIYTAFVYIEEQK